MNRVMRKPHNASASVENIIADCFKAYKTNDRALCESLIADDLHFTSPQDDAIDRAEYFKRCWPNSKSIENVVIERLFVEGEEAFVTYLMTLNDGRQFTNTEFMTVRNGKISNIEVFFGPSFKDGHVVVNA